MKMIKLHIRLFLTHVTLVGLPNCYKKIIKDEKFAKRSSHLKFYNKLRDFYIHSCLIQYCDHSTFSNVIQDGPKATWRF